MQHASDKPARTGFCLADWGALAVLAAVCLANRAGWLDVVSLDPDESQYEAQASYLLATGQSAPRATPFGPVYAVEIYRQVGLAFGPYSTRAVRVLVLVLSIVYALLTYLVVRQAAGRWPALVAGLIVAVLNIYFQGRTTNREWFAGTAALAGIWLFLAARDRRPVQAAVGLAASGFCCGWAPWLKEQALLFVLPVPLALVAEALVERRFRRPLQTALWYAAGGLAATLLAMLPFLWAGTLGTFFELMRKWAALYSRVETVQIGPESLSTLYWQAFYESLPARRVFLLAYAAAGLVAAGAIAQGFRRWSGKGRRPPSPPDAQALDRFWITSLVCLAYLACGLVTVEMGKRFFPHYYLFLLPGAAMLVGLLLGWLDEQVDAAPTGLDPRRLVGGLLAGLVVADLLVLPVTAHLPHEAQPWTWPAEALVPWSAALVAAGGLMLAARSMSGQSPQNAKHSAAPPIAAAEAAQPTAVSHPPRQATAQRSGPPALLSLPSALRFAPVILAALIVADLARLWVPTIDSADDAENRKTLLRLPDLEAFFARAAHPGDRLFVWGWRPELYSLTRLEAATRFGICSYIVIDASRDQQDLPPYLPETSQLLIDDLKSRRPRFVVDASRRSQTLTRPGIYDLSNYPPLVELLAADYRRVATLDGCDVYERR